MNNERYEVSDGMLYLIDPELGLKICEPFSLPLLPKIEERSKAPSDLEVIWQKSDQGYFEKAYGKKQGLFHGQYMHFHPCGEVKGESFYLEGKLHGPSLFRSSSGNIVSSSWFYHGSIVGKSRQFYESGALYSLQQYKKGKLHGKQQFFYEDQSPKTLLQYNDGRLDGGIELYWPSGQVKRRAFYEEGLRKGADMLWSPEGILLDLSHYLKGHLSGVQQKRYPSGILKEELFYHEPNRFDRLVWNAQGQLEYEGRFIDHETFQETITHYPEGTKEVRKGKWDGKQVYF